jgi:hypothetical protein
MQEKLDKSILFPLSQTEKEIIIQLQGLEETKETRNVLRRAMRLLAQKHGLELGEGVFADRSQGNRLPKPKKPPAE